MAYNTGFIAEPEQSLRHGSEIHTVPESPNLDGLPTDGAPHHPKRPRTLFPPLADSLDRYAFPPSEAPTPSEEMKILIVSTCHAIVKLELTLSNLDAKSNALEQHRLNGPTDQRIFMQVNKLPEGVYITDLLLSFMNIHELVTGLQWAVGSSYVS